MSKYGYLVWRGPVLMLVPLVVFYFIWSGLERSLDIGQWDGLVAASM